MGKDKIAESLQQLNPTKEQSERMLENIKAMTANNKNNIILFDENREKQNKKNSHRVLKYVAMIAITVGIVSITGFGVDAMTGGKVADVIKSIINPSSQNDIINQAQNEIGTYASDLMYIDSEMLAFGNVRGILVFDKETDNLIGTIDTQKIDCIYFDSDNKHTCMVKDEDSLIVFNTNDNKPYGKYYVYKDKVDENGNYILEKSGSDETKLEKYFKIWENMHDKSLDTFQEFRENDELSYVFSEDNKEYQVTYSQKALSWEDVNEQQYVSFVVAKDREYVVYNYNKNENVFEKDVLQFPEEETDTNATNYELPKFVYSEDDAAIKAICEYLYNRDKEYFESQNDKVWIPEFVIYKEEVKRDKCIVYGNFWSGIYKKTGNVLENDGGGEMPGRITLKKNGDTYIVEEAVFAGDGSEYASSIRKFTLFKPGLYEQYMDKTKGRQEARQKFIGMYVRDNNLDVKYYKDSGWDPVELK